MSQVITFLAKPPPDLEGDAIDRDDDGNNAVELTAKTMQDAIASGNLHYSARLERVAYVDDIVAVLAATSPPPELIQIIGHGSPGRIQLGGYWGASPSVREGQDILDSSPDSYGILSEYLSSKTTVLLLGCSVGAAAPKSYVASGRALMFDLEDMSGCHVYAADDLVTVADFHDDFLYFGSLTTSTGKPANPAGRFVQRVVRVEPKTEPQPPEHFAITKVRSAVALGRPYAVESLPGTRFEAYLSLDRPGGLLAMTELEIETDKGRVEVICGGTMLRIRVGRKTLYYQFQEEGRVGTNNDWLVRLREAYVRGRHNDPSPDGELPPVSCV